MSKSANWTRVLGTRQGHLGGMRHNLPTAHRQTCPRQQMKQTLWRKRTHHRWKQQKQQQKKKRQKQQQQCHCLRHRKTDALWDLKLLRKLEVRHTQQRRQGQKELRRWQAPLRRCPKLRRWHKPRRVAGRLCMLVHPLR